MSNITPVIPMMKVGLVVVTPAVIDNITINKKYVVEKLEDNHIFIRNDIDKLETHKSYMFIEADLYFTMCLYSTMITLYKLGSKSYK